MKTTLQFTYVNYKNETGIRKVEPNYIYYGFSIHHPEYQWLLNAYDLEKKDFRDFAVKDICGKIEVLGGTQEEDKPLVQQILLYANGLSRR
jgi:predicted DNA-binding transcriptional regulator YafY